MLEGVCDNKGLNMKNHLLVILLFSGLLSAQSLTPPVNVSMGNFAGSILLGKLASANMNSTADQAIPISSSKYVIRRIVAVNASTSLTLAVGGFYAAASKATAIVANTQVFSALTGASKYLDCTVNALALSDIRTETTLYLSLTVAQGGAATMDVYVFGDTLP